MHKLAFAANSAEVAAVAQVRAAANAAQDGRYLIAPYGDYPHGAGFVQHFGRGEAEQIVAAFGGLLNRIKQALGFGTAVPVYRGHPDDGAFSARADHADKSVYGAVQALEACADGLWARIAWEPAFGELPKGLHFSPRWLGRLSDDGKTLYPLRLESLGLTANPNIGGTSAANETITTMNKDMLLALGYSEEEADAILNKTEGAATDADILAKIQSLAEAARAAEAAKAEAEAAKAEAEAAKTDADAQKAEAEAAKTQAANERAARAALVLDNAIAANCITQAERAEWEKTLAQTTDFAAVSNALLSRKTDLHTRRETSGAGTRADGDDAAAARKKFNEAVAANERAGMSYADAWVSARRDMPETYDSAYQR